MDRRLARLCTDAFLLARYGGAGPVTDGRVWERAVSGGLWAGRRVRRQHAGTLGLFGRPSRSGARHELDGALHDIGLGVWLEAKAVQGLHKSEVACFAFKAEDLYRQAAAENPAWVAGQAWWQLLVSAHPCSESVHRCAASRGIVLCEPSVMPLPALLHVAGLPEADMRVDGVLLGQLLDLAEPVCRPIQQRLVIDPDARTIGMSLDAPDATHIGDLLHVQHELTGQLLDHYDSRRPGQLDERGRRLAGGLRRYAVA